MEIPGYEIEKVIGKGGMASVYLATHKALNRKVAIKVMHPQDDDNSDFTSRFIREAHIVANLSHPNIVTIHDVGEHDGHNYLVMELLPGGETLNNKIKKGIDSQQALSIIRQVAAALKVAHDKNIVHRDIKPDNIMFRDDGSVVLMDFGIARSVDSTATQMTQAGLIVGTPQYISPEQAQGEDLGAYSDIYSLGVVFYEMLTGKLPYTADSPIALVFQHVSEPVPTLTGDAAVFQPLLNHMMAKARQERYSDCDRIIADINKLETVKPATQATNTFNSADIEKSIAASEGLTIVGDINADQVKAREKSRAKPSAKQKNAKRIPVNKTKPADASIKLELEEISSGKKNSKLKSLLWIVLASIAAGSAYTFIDVDTGKLKTLIGIDPGPVYPRVGRLISISSGTFKMGNNNGDSTEKPAHPVRIKPFKLGETEVTQKQWHLVMGSTPSYFKGCAECPVDSVSWKDVQGFLKKLNKQTGLRFRLPSEAEWEYACRNEGNTEKYCGSGSTTEFAWYGVNSNNKTHPVAQKQANDLGLYDMSGNVWEWTQDCWHNSYQGAPSSGKPWASNNCGQRVLRGGSWIGVTSGLTSTGRFKSFPSEGNRNFGFRVALDM